MSILHGIILAIVEGLTEYLPVSSTGHIILASAWLGIESQEFTKDYTVIVQFGAILSVVVVYFQRFKANIALFKKIIYAVIPALVLGFLLKDFINRVLGSVEVVAYALIAGGVVLLFIEKYFKNPKEISIENISTKNAVLIGLSQCIAFLPGVSRSAASILGGMAAGFDRKNAAEFSFLLAVPTLSAATCYKLLKIYPTITSDQISVILIGNIVSFIVGLIAIKGFIQYLTKYGLVLFGWYRIVLGVIILWLTVPRG